MSHYRLFFIRPSSTHFADCEEFDAKTDADALASAEQRTRGAAMELWCDERKLWSWQRPDPPSRVSA